jgi:hypothetical protein
LNVGILVSLGFTTAALIALAKPTEAFTPKQGN